MDLLLDALARPESLPDWSLTRWEPLIDQARRAKLLARIACLLEEQGLLCKVHRQPAAHLEAVLRVAARQRSEVRWEADRIRRALADVDLPVILLKGAAYIAAALPCSRGRLLSDIDILVPRERLAEAEGALFHHGWITTHLDAYDQRYYRTWMHELPPMQHVSRQTVLDVHHSIAPPTSRYRVNAAALFGAAQALADHQGLRTLASVDIVLHSATHLILESEFENGLRDLVDIDDLLRFFGTDNAFWPELAKRAAELNLGRALYLAVDLASRVLGTPIPETFYQALRPHAPSMIVRVPLAKLFEAAMHPQLPSCSGAGAGVARWLLYVRGHYLRMPMRLLVPHLMRKGWRQGAASP